MKFPRRFFEAVIGDALDQGDLDVEVRCLGRRHERNPQWPEQFWFRNLSEFEKSWCEVEDRNLSGFDTHFTVLPRRNEFHGKKEHPLPEPLIISALWADLDVGKGKPYEREIDALRRIQHVDPLPNIIVESGAGLHPYWLVEIRELSKERLERLLRCLSEKLEGDNGAARASRLMRVPNTYNWKYGKHGKRVRIHYLSETRYRLSKLERLWKVSEESDENPTRETGESRFSNFFSQHLTRFAVRGSEATALCPFHDDKDPSFSVNLVSGLWICHSSRCKAQGNVEQFCKRLDIPNSDVGEPQRFPRLRKISDEDEWSNEDLFTTILDYVMRQIYFGHSWQPVVVCLWAMGTYLYRQFPCYGHLWLNSPTTHSGKSKLENVLWTICYKAMEPQVEPTSAVLFRFPSAIGGTLILDEVDNLSPEKRSDVIAVLNSYYSNAAVMRNTPGPQKKFVLEKFPIFCPKVIAGIENLPFTLQDRCLKISMHRKKSSENLERFMPDSLQSMEHTRDQLEAWAVRNGPRIVAAYQEREALGVPQEVDDRLKDLTEPLYAIATVLPKWVKAILIEGTRNLYRDRTSDEAESNPVVLGVQVLKEQFPEAQEKWNLRSETALQVLSAEIPSIATKAEVQALLRRIGFRSKRLRFGNRVLRGYEITSRKLERLSERYQVEPKAV